MKVKVTLSLFLTPWIIHTVHGVLQARILEWVISPFARDLPNPGIKPTSPILQVDSLSAEPQWKPKNTGMGSLSLLQWIFLTQESNQGPLPCRQILYQLSYQGSPGKPKEIFYFSSFPFFPLLSSFLLPPLPLHCQSIIVSQRQIPQIKFIDSAMFSFPKK